MLTARQPRKPDTSWMVGYLFILPAILGFIVFYLYPALRGFQISFTDWNLLSAPRNVGLDNYTTAIHDPKFWSALGITFKYVLWNSISARRRPAPRCRRPTPRSTRCSGKRPCPEVAFCLFRALYFGKILSF